jgi:hypothetical protein
VSDLSSQPLFQELSRKFAFASLPYPERVE